MASYSKSAFILTIFFAGAIMAAKAGRVSPPPPSPTIVKACSTAQYKDLCIGSLSSAPGALKADMKELAMIAVKLASKKRMIFLAMFLMSTEKKGSDIEDSVSDARTWLSAAYTNPDTCFDGLSNHPDISALIQRRSLYLSKLMSNALAVTAKLADEDDP
ncbi:hypothetical protein SUGI_0263360 [Cryptomeria japonica]|nr:hypothetical protein SUGI_0263360 [Cryptomeria japonica]